MGIYCNAQAVPNALRNFAAQVCENSKDLLGSPAEREALEHRLTYN